MDNADQRGLLRNKPLLVNKVVLLAEFERMSERRKVRKTAHAMKIMFGEKKGLRPRQTSKVVVRPRMLWAY